MAWLCGLATMVAMTFPADNEINFLPRKAGDTRILIVQPVMFIRHHFSASGSRQALRG